MIGSYPRTRAVRESRRLRAEAVQARSAALSTIERIAKLNELGLNAAKERAKLARKLFKEMNKPVPSTLKESK